MKKKEFTYYGLGFPIILQNVPMKKYWGEEMPDINYKLLQRIVVELLAKKETPLTGNELRFVRQYFEMNYTEFGKHFGQSRQAVAKWESKGDEYSCITPSTELYIRLAILNLLKTSDKTFRQVYHTFDQSENLKQKKYINAPSMLSINSSLLRKTA